MSILKIQIEKNSHQKMWITSDTHYGHKNICRGVTSWRLPNGDIPIESTRDFKTVDEMNDMIVKNINSVVGQDDILIHAGDFSFGGFENIEKFRNRIICKIIHIIHGNHDEHIVNNKNNYQDLFASNRDYMTLILNGETIEIFHYPINSWNGLSKGIIHLFGHQHSNNKEKFKIGRSMDIGIDGNPHFRPYDILNEIIPLMKKREILSNIKNDHHIDKIR